MRYQTRESKSVIKEDHIDGILADCKELVGTLSSVNLYWNGGLLKVTNKTYRLPGLPENLLLRISELIGRPIVSQNIASVSDANGGVLMVRIKENTLKPRVRINTVLIGEPAEWLIEWRRRGLITSYTDAITQALRVLHERILEHDLKTVKAEI